MTFCSFTCIYSQNAQTGNFGNTGSRRRRAAVGGGLKLGFPKSDCSGATERGGENVEEEAELRRTEDGTRRAAGTKGRPDRRDRETRRSAPGMRSRGRVGP